MTDLTKLKELAERALVPAKGNSLQTSVNMDNFNRLQFTMEANPQAILGLIADLEEARNGMEYQPIMRLKNELDRLKAENEALRKLLDSGRYYIPENKIELLGLIDAALEGGGK